jgi:uncharacterized protein (TIGR03067 family)
LHVEGDHYTFILGETDLRMTFKLDPTKTPKTIDMKIIEGPCEGQTFHGIYTLEGDIFRICRHVDLDMERPKEFTTLPDSGIMIVTWKRLP